MPLTTLPQPRSSLGRFLTRCRVLKARMGATPAAFRSPPEPRSIGDAERGEWLSEGAYLTSGFDCDLGENAIWDAKDAPDHTVASLHGFEWLDDLAAWGDDAAKTKAQNWQREWVRRFGFGAGPGWTVDVVGQRLIRWVSHADFTGLLSDEADPVLTSLNAQLRFLGRYCHSAPTELAKKRAFAGVICAGLATTDNRDKADRALAAVKPLLDNWISEDGALPSRNPEEVLEVLTLLAVIFRACEDHTVTVPDGLAQHAQTIAPTLRALRHNDGSLARFHGGARGAQGGLDSALAFAGTRADAPLADPMGFARMTSGAMTVIVDANAPALGKNSAFAHASCNGIEVNYGLHPVFVSCGTGIHFGPDAHLASRQTAAHSTLVVEGTSCADFLATRKGHMLIQKTPDQFPFKRTRAIDGMRVQTGHNGYADPFGLTHARTLDLSTDGKTLAGEDMLVAQTGSEVTAFKAALQQLGRGITADIHFHLHPDIRADIEPADGTVKLYLANGQVWDFKHDGIARLSLRDTVYYQQNRAAPLGSVQIVLSYTASEPVTRVRWTLAKSDGGA